MLSLKFLAAVLFFSSLFTGGTSSSCRSESNKVAPIPSENIAGELKVIAEGAHSPVTTAFVAVIRDTDTYAALRQVASNIPELDADFFKSNVVIAAFLGERNTGGYSVEITRDTDGKIRVAEKAPGKDMMVPQMITAPFKVVSLATAGTPPVSVSVADSFHQTAELYRISSGTFSISGGFAGRTETFQLTGKLQVSRLGNLITIGFAVVSTGAQRERQLREMATGVVSDNGITINRLSRGSLVDTPSGDFHLTGRFLDKNKLTLALDTGVVTVPDGYSGKGSIEAEMVSASAN